MPKTGSSGVGRSRPKRAFHEGKVAPAVGFEPTTKRLTAARSTTELRRNGSASRVREARAPRRAGGRASSAGGRIASRRLALRDVRPGQRRHEQKGVLQAPSGRETAAASIERGWTSCHPLSCSWSLAGFVGGIVLFLRGLVAYRRDRLISSVATSSLEAIAAGEVRVSGVVEAIHATLISPLQSKPCVWYRARVEESGGDDRRVLLDEERATQFRIKDESGAIRVLPQGARWEIVPDFDESHRPHRSGAARPAAPRRCRLRPGRPGRPGADDRARAPGGHPGPADGQASRSQDAPAGWDRSGGDLGAAISLGTSRGRRYREARLEPGDVGHHHRPGPPLVGRP